MPTYLTEPSLITDIRNLNNRISKLEQVAGTGSGQADNPGSGSSSPSSLDPGDYVNVTGDTMTGALTLQSNLNATTALFTGNVTINGTLTVASGGFALDSEVVHKALAETVTGVKSFTSEQRFYSGTYTDPDPGVTRAFKVGNLGIAVGGGIKTDTLASSAGITVTGGTITTTGLTASSVIVANGGVQFGGILDLTPVTGTLAASTTGIGDKIGLNGTSYGIGAQTNRLVLFADSAGGVSVRPASASGNKSSGADAHTFLASGAATHTGSLTVGSGFTVTAGAVSLPTRTLTGTMIAFDTVTGVGASGGTGVGNLAQLTVGTDNIANSAVTSTKLSDGAVASRHLETGGVRDTNTTMFRTATASTTTASGDSQGGLTPGTGMTRSADTQAFDGVAIFSGSAIAGASTSGPAYTKLKPGEYKATWYIWSDTALNNSPLLTLNVSGTGVTAVPVTITSKQLNSNSKYVGYSVAFTVTTDTNSVNTTITHQGGAWRWSHVTAQLRQGPVDNEIQTQYIRDLAVTSAKIESLSAGKIVAGTIESDDIYLGQGGHIYAGAKDGGRVELNVGGILAYTTQNLYKNAFSANFEDGSTVWQAANATVANVATPVFEGTRALRFTVTTVATETRVHPYGVGTDGIPCSASAQYVSSVYVRGAQVRPVSHRVYFYTAAGAFISSSNGADTSVSTSAWTRLSTSFVTPANAAFMLPHVYVSTLNAIAGEIFYVDAGQVERGSIPSDFVTYLTPSTTSFYLRSNGDLTLKGSITAGSTITGTTITGTTGISAGTGNAIFIAGSSGIQLGHATFASAPFSVDMAGNLVATAATIQGTMTAGTISGVNITATNTIHGGAIIAGTLSADAVSIGSLMGVRNPNADFETAGANQQTVPNWVWDWESTGTITSYGRVADPTPRATGFVYKINPAINAGAAIASDAIAVEPGQSWEVSSQVFTDHASAKIYFSIQFGASSSFTRFQLVAATPNDAAVANGNGPVYGPGVVNITDNYSPPVNTWTLMRGWVKVPAGATHMRVTLYAWQNASQGYNAYFDDARASQRVGGTYIAGGSIETEHITANSLSGNVITAGTLTADKIGTGTLTASTYILAGNASTGVIIDGRTATAGVRLVKAGVTTVNLDALTGDATFTGVVNAASGSFSGSISSSATITGGTIQTATGTGSRIVLDSTGLSAYNASNVALTTITSAGGVLTADNATLTNMSATGTIRALGGGGSEFKLLTSTAYIIGGTGYSAATISGVGLVGSQTGLVMSSSTNSSLQLYYDATFNFPNGGFFVVNAAASIYGTLLATGGLQTDTGVNARSSLTTTGLEIFNSSNVKRSEIVGSTGTIYSYGTGGPTSDYTRIAGSAIYFKSTPAAAGLAYIQAVGLSGSKTGLTISTSGSSAYFQMQDGTINCVASTFMVNSNPKTFVIDHPTPAKSADQYLVHAVIEGPTSDVFYRGEGSFTPSSAPFVAGEPRVQSVTVTLPDYFEDVAEVEGRTVTVTPIVGGCPDPACANLLPPSMGAGRVVDGEFKVYALAGFVHDCAEFYWEVKAVRKSTQFEVEPMKADYVKHGDGPYSYLTEA